MGLCVSGCVWVSVRVSGGLLEDILLGNNYINAVFIAIIVFIVFFANSFVATTGTNTRNATFKSVHSALLQ